MRNVNTLPLCFMWIPIDSSYLGVNACHHLLCSLKTVHSVTSTWSVLCLTSSDKHRANGCLPSSLRSRELLVYHPVNAQTLRRSDPHASPPSYSTLYCEHVDGDKYMKICSAAIKCRWDFEANENKTLMLMNVPALGYIILTDWLHGAERGAFFGWNPCECGLVYFTFFFQYVYDFFFNICCLPTTKWWLSKEDGHVCSFIYLALFCSCTPTILLFLLFLSSSNDKVNGHCANNTQIYTIFNDISVRYFTPVYFPLPRIQ